VPICMAVTANASALYEPLVERAEHRDEQHGQNADPNPAPHAGRHAAQQRHHTGDGHGAEQQVARVESAPRREEREKYGSQRHADGAHGSVRGLDGQIEREPVLSEKRPHARVRRHQAARLVRQDRHTRGTHDRTAATRAIRQNTRGSAGSVISRRKMAVKPQSRTQRWIWNCALVVGDISEVLGSGYGSVTESKRCQAVSEVLAAAC
jgi:hypothetical protein